MPERRTALLLLADRLRGDEDVPRAELRVPRPARPSKGAAHQRAEGARLSRASRLRRLRRRDAGLGNDGSRQRAHARRRRPADRAPVRQRRFDQRARRDRMDARRRRHRRLLAGCSGRLLPSGDEHCRRQLRRDLDRQLGLRPRRHVARHGREREQTVRRRRRRQLRHLESARRERRYYRGRRHAAADVGLHRQPGDRHAALRLHSPGQRCRRGGADDRAGGRWRVGRQDCRAIRLDDLDDAHARDHSDRCRRRSIAASYSAGVG